MTEGSPGGNVCVSWLRQGLHTLPLLCAALWPPPSLPNPPVPHVQPESPVRFSDALVRCFSCSVLHVWSSLFSRGYLFATPSRPKLPPGRKERCPLQEADVKMGVSSQTCWMHLAPCAQKDPDFGDSHCPIFPTGFRSLLLLPPVACITSLHTYTSHVAPSHPLKKADAGCNQRG